MSEGPAHHGPPLGTRAAVLCSVADQGVSALTNIAVLVVAARLSSAPAFAVFSLVYMVATVLLGLFAGYVGQALVLLRGEPARDASRAAVAFTACAACVIGFTGTAVLALLRLPGEVPRGLGALGLVLPAVLCQDGLRYCFSALRLPQHALVADALRLAVTVPCLAAQPAGSGPARLVLVWGACALPALALGGLLLAPRLRGAGGDPRELLRRGHLGWRFAVEFAVGNGASQLAVLGLGLFASPLAVGALRGASTLYGPMNVLCNSATAFGPPLLRRATAGQRTAGDGEFQTGKRERGREREEDESAKGARRTVRATALLAALLALAAAAWTLLLSALPAAVGRQLLGATWDSAVRLLPATGSQYAAIALATSALLALRVLRPRATLPIQVTFSLVSVGLLLTGYALGGVLGAAWGLCLGSALKAAALWLRTGSVYPDNRTPASGNRSPGGNGAPGYNGNGNRGSNGDGNRDGNRNGNRDGNRDGDGTEDTAHDQDLSEQPGQRPDGQPGERPDEWPTTAQAQGVHRPGL